MAIKLILDQDQKDVVEYSLDRPYSIIAVDPGGGKTAIALAIKDELDKRGKYQRLLVVAPANLTINWYLEIKITITDQVVSLFKKKADVYYPVDSDIVIVSYDTAREFEYLFEWANFVVLDEATSVSHMDTLRSKAIHKYIYENNIPRMHPMSGTPLKNRVKEFYSLIALCNYNPKIPESRFLTEFANDIEFADRFSYRKEFAKYINNRRISIVKWEGLKNEEELKSHLKGIYIRRKSKRDPIIFESFLMDDTEDMQLLKDFLEAEGISSKSVGSKAKIESAMRKVPITARHVERKIEAGQIEGPVIIFSDHVDSCKLLAGHFGVAPITGQMPVTIRQKMVQDFQEGKIPVLCATIGSMYQGYTLTAGNYMCFNDFCWTPGDMKQCFYRINRLGQKRQCFVDLIFGSPQDKYIYDKQMEKLEVINRF